MGSKCVCVCVCVCVCEGRATDRNERGDQIGEDQIANRDEGPAQACGHAAVVDGRVWEAQAVEEVGEGHGDDGVRHDNVESKETGGDTFDRGVGEGVEEESLDATTLEAVRDDGGEGVHEGHD